MAIYQCTLIMHKNIPKSFDNIQNKIRTIGFWGGGAAAPFAPSGYATGGHM